MSTGVVIDADDFAEEVKFAPGVDLRHFAKQPNRACLRISGD
jgi:hypothetical protein